MFASQTTTTVTLPSDPSVTVTIGRLTWLQARDAKNVSQRESMKSVAAMGGMKAIKELQEDSTPGAPAADPDPYLLHDPLTVLVCGVKGWSVPAPVSLDTLSDLGEEDAEFLARSILALGKRRVTPEPERKNDDAPSTAI